MVGGIGLYDYLRWITHLNGQSELGWPDIMVTKDYLPPPTNTKRNIFLKRYDWYKDKRETRETKGELRKRKWQKEENTKKEEP